MKTMLSYTSTRLSINRIKILFQAESTLDSYIYPVVELLGHHDRPIIDYLNTYLSTFHTRYLVVGTKHQPTVPNVGKYLLLGTSSLFNTIANY